MKNLTALIVSFFRTEYLELCLKSLRDKYPDIKIIIGNNGPEDEEKENLARKYGAEYYKLPFDCGICVGRNKLISKIKTKYTLIGDDDFYYTEEANVDKLLKICEMGEFDLIGGRIREGGTIRNYQGFIEEHGNFFKYIGLDLNKEAGKWTDFGLVYPCDITFNYFIAETEKLRKVKWDEKIKVAYEHSSYFIDFKRAGFKTAFWPGAIVEHKPSINIKNNEEYDNYKIYRGRKSDKKRFFQKYKIQYVIDMSGRMDCYDGTNISDITFCITHFERKEGLRNLLFSIVKKYPFARILIGDQSQNFYSNDYRQLWDALEAQGLKVKPKAINLPYDCGLSFARNRLVELAETKYVLILEDDFEFTSKTIIESLVDILTEDDSIALAGGDVCEHNISTRFNFFWQKKGKTLNQIPDGDNYKKTIDGLNYKITGSTMNFFLAKKELFLDIKWDEDLKINSEHTDFFYRLSDMRWKVAFTPDVSVIHNKELDRDILEEYSEKRGRRDFFKILFSKHQINKLNYLDGYVVAMKDGKIITGRNIK